MFYHNNNNNNNNSSNNNNNGGVMFRPACGAPAFTDHRHSKSLDLCPLINPYRYQ